MSDESATGTGSPGALLRAAREKQGLHIAALAAAIKVSPRKLDALEGDRFEELPDATFTRALAQTVCRQLKIDARPVLDLLPPAGRVELETRPGGLNAPFRERPGRDDPGPASVALRPLVVGAVLLVGAALGLYFMPASWWSARAPAAASAASQAASVAVAVLPAPVAAPAASEAVVAPEPAASAPAGETVFSAPPPNPAASESGAPAGLVQLRSSEASWVEARDARGQVLLYRMVLPGESVGLDGALPIRLTVGNAAATQIGFRGKPVDLGPSTRDNVARVELQ